MSDSEPVKRRGRPRVPEEKRKGTLTFRLRADLRERIEERARETGKSVSEVVEFLLDLSLDPDGFTQRKVQNDLTVIFNNQLRDLIQNAALQITRREILGCTQEIRSSILEEIKQEPYKFTHELTEENNHRKINEMIEWRVNKYLEGS